MRITALLENTTHRPELSAEHGLSLWLDLGERQLLFDAGQTSLFADNARTLGLDLSRIDAAVLSHGHYDHGGGLMEFLWQNHRAPLYIRPDAFERHVALPSRFNGIEAALAQHPQVRLTGDETDLGQGVRLFTGNGRPRPYYMDNYGLCVERAGQLLPDDFTHEQYLLYHRPQGDVLITGCSHKGILNILSWLDTPPRAVVGGFHLMKADPAGDEAMDAVARGLKEYPQTVFYTCHCTGQEQYQYLKARLGEQLCYLSTGQSITL